MFEVRLMVEDKNIPKVLWALDGLIAGMPTILPVRAAAVKKTAVGKRVVSTQPLPGQSLVAQVSHKLMNWPNDTIVWPEFVELMMNVGVNKDSKGYITNTLRKLKVIKLLSKNNRKPIYKILKSETEA